MFLRELPPLFYRCFVSNTVVFYVIINDLQCYWYVFAF
jgi:hypothetical protein